MTRHIRFGVEMEHARWDETADRWIVETSDGVLAARVLVSAIGATAEPDDPDDPGLACVCRHPVSLRPLES